VKTLRFIAILLVPGMLMSACSTNLGLGRLLGGGGAAVGTPKTPKTASVAQGSVSVSIASAKFRPKNLTVKIGTVLTWTNNDAVPQSVTSDSPGIFDSGPIQPGGTFSHTFSQAGVFPYHSTSTSSSFGSVTVVQ
jgi:plastocyanin